MVFNDLEVLNIAKLSLKPLNIIKLRKWILSSSEESDWHFVDSLEV